MSDDARRELPCWRGARIDPRAMLRDTVLAGGFGACNVLAGTLDAMWIPVGFLFAGGLGAFLHVVPGDPIAEESRSARILLRGASGLVGGAWAGAGVGFLASGALVDAADQPLLTSLMPNALVGAVTGCAWYVAWGVWETRRTHGRSSTSPP